MGFMGKLIKNAGSIAGTVAEYGLKATGEVIGMVAEAADKPELAEKSRKVSSGIGEFVGGTTKVIAEGAGFAMDKAIELGSKAGGEIGATIAKSKGASDEQINKSRVVGNAIGGGLVGLATGDLIGTAVTGVAAATGVASTGTAIATLHGAAATKATLAAVGGGALSAGGGGIAAGQAILHGIDAATTVAGSIDGVIRSKSAEDKKKLEDKSRYVNSDYKIIE